MGKVEILFTLLISCGCSVLASPALLSTLTSPVRTLASTLTSNPLPYIQSLPNTEEHKSCLRTTASPFAGSLTELPLYLTQIFSYLSSITNNSAGPDAYLDTPEVARNHGYEVETHNITTEDGYILTYHRIPTGKNSECASRRPVLLQHGLFSESTHWLYQPDGRCLPYMLADACYDVWLGNARGNRYSRSHINYTTSDPQYWRFGWDEMGKFDIPASIDYILSTTGFNQTFYIGHSMGTTMFFVMMSERPEYNQKVSMMTAYGPAAYLNHIITPVRVASPVFGVPYLSDVLNAVGQGEFFPNSIFQYLKKYDAPFCTPYLTGALSCSAVVFALMGYDYPQMNRTLLPTIMSTLPSSTSSQAMIQYFQEMNCVEPCFRKLDRGPDGNNATYGQITPPEYDLGKVMTPTAFFYGANDWLADPTDVIYAAGKIGNLVNLTCVNFAQWNHIDFLWGIDAKEKLYLPTLDLLSKY